MNCPSRVDETLGHDGYNQNPPPLAADSTTRQDLNGIANSRLQRDHRIDPEDHNHDDGSGAETSARPDDSTPHSAPLPKGNKSQGEEPVVGAGTGPGTGDLATTLEPPSPFDVDAPSDPRRNGSNSFIRRFWHVAKKYMSFIGPGFLVAVAYIDPGNYSTDVSAGATFRFALLFIVLMSNLFAIFLQSLCVKLGSVTGMNLAEMCRAHLPKWLNYFLYILAEAAIIATDIAEVIGSAIALNLLIKVPLVAGCAITIVDVIIILLFYSPWGSMTRVRAFEFFVVALVLGVVICFCIQLSLIKDTTVGEVFKGYLPSSSVVQSDGLYQSCGILGATVMPHSLFLGSGVVQSRLRDFDIRAGNVAADDSDSSAKYRPSLAAIKSCLSYSIVELAISLFTFALFVNSAILIVAGASLSNTESAQSADLFGIYSLLNDSLASAAGTIFALALLLSGTSAGIVCTIAGQMVSEGMLNWSVAPWVRRLVTRSISIVPSIIIAGSIGKEGLSDALNASQVVLSVILPFVSAPLIYFTCRSQYMKVEPSQAVERIEDIVQTGSISMKNNWVTTIFAVLIWLVIAVMNVALLVLVGMGKA